MGTQTMGSQGDVGDSTAPKPSTLCRQGSLYNLTLDEVQVSLGKPLSSMNLDELLKNVWNVEANQLLEIGGGNDGVEKVGNTESGSNLNRQSSFLLLRDLSKKTVDEVWKEIQRGKKGSGTGGQERDPERQNTLGEMTLEDFLVHAGVVLDAPDGNGNKNGKSGQSGWVGVEPNVGRELNISKPAECMHYQFLPQQQQQQQSVMSTFMPGQHVLQTISVGGVRSDSGFSEGQLAVSPSPLMGTLADVQLASRKRGAPSIVIEKTFERRQKRMIKNRESAARSRARKQAYTNELENKVSRLEAENERLKKMREMEKALLNVPPPRLNCQLPRTSSSPF